VELVCVDFRDEFRRFTDCIDLAAAIGAICAFVIAAAVRISSRRGLTLLLIEIVLWWAPDVRQDATKVVASERAREES
jgi:hypothetical protein